ncbi:MAG TPA: hypothetical protein VMX36_01190 [Sedimentisphaerales bacterium]|nr:hypothetical protein [Sedimentisphaerales bacterium]
MRKFKNYGKAGLAVALLIGIAVSIFSLARLVQAEPIDTYHAGWNLVRASDDEDAASFAAEYDLSGVTDGISGAFEDMSASAFKIPSLPSDGLGSAPGTKWKFVICGKLYDDVGGTFSYSLVGWAKENGMLQVICEGTGALGDQAVVNYPDGDDALGELISETGVTYTHATKTFTDTTGTKAFDGAAVGMMARLTSVGGFTDAIMPITTFTDANIFICSGLTSAANKTNATVQINPSFWADTIVVTSLTKWSAAGTANANTDTMANNIAVLNSADNEVAVLVVDLAGLEYIQFVLFDCDGASGEEAGDLRVYGRPY